MVRFLLSTVPRSTVKEASQNCEAFFKIITLFRRHVEYFGINFFIYFNTFQFERH